jgi:hypothetical protein
MTRSLSNAPWPGPPLPPWVTSACIRYTPSRGARRSLTRRPAVGVTADGLIYASSMAMLDSARRGVQVPVLALVAGTDG